MQHRQNWGMVCVNFWSELDLAPELKTRVNIFRKNKIEMSFIHYSKWICSSDTWK